jgi:hypothetical protein
MTIEAESRSRVIGDTDVTLGALRKKVWRSLTPAVAYDAGISLEETARFLKMTYTPDGATLCTLARRLGML